MHQPASKQAECSDAAAAAFAGRFGDQLSRADSVRAQHGRDESYHPGQAPDLVLFARSTRDVQDAVQLCRTHGLAVIAWGSGSSLEGHVHAVQRGLTIDLSAMDQILQLDSEDMTVRVQAGVRRKQLNQHLRQTGLFFSVDPGADATLGGMAATRASGTTAVRYGTMRSNVLNCTVVLADGSVITTARRAPKSSAGYDLTALMVGSEGTLGIITELTLKLHPEPEAVAALSCCFDTSAQAIALVGLVSQMGLNPARIEFADQAMMRAINAYEKSKAPEGFMLFVELHGPASGMADQLASFTELAEGAGATAITTATQTEDRAQLWRARHNALYAAKALSPGRQCLITDVCVPVSRLAECIEATQADLAASPLISTLVGHVGDGNFHAFILVDPADAAETAAAEALHEAMARRAIALDGTCTGEHGIGIGKRHLLREELGAAVDTMQLIKRALDPDNRLNPGKIF